MTNKIEPIGKRVLAKKHEEKDPVVKGIIMPDTAKHKKYEIEVVAIGSEVTKVKVGDKISCQSYGGREIIKDNEAYMIVNEDEIFAIIHD